MSGDSLQMKACNCDLWCCNPSPPRNEFTCMCMVQSTCTCNHDCIEVITSISVAPIPDPTKPEPPNEEFFFSFGGHPYTQIRAKRVAIMPIGPGQRAIDVQFGEGMTHTVRIIIDIGYTELIGSDGQRHTTKPTDK